MNIYDKRNYVLVIKLTMHMRYRIFLMIKLQISRHLFLRGGGSSRPSSLFLYLCLFFDVDMVTRNGCSYVLSCVKTCVVSTVWQEIPQSFDPHLQPFSIRNAFINSRSSTVNGATIYAPLFTHGWRHFWRHTIDVHKTSKNIVKTMVKTANSAVHSDVNSEPCLTC